MSKFVGLAWAYVVHKLRTSCVQLVALGAMLDTMWQWPVCNPVVVPRFAHSQTLTCTTTVRAVWAKVRAGLYPSSTGPIRTTTRYINLILVRLEGALVL